MKDETPAWLSYADENLYVAELSLVNNHLNACLHNAQQALPIPSFQCLAGCDAGSGDMRKVCTYRSPCRGECEIGINGQSG